jgi:hypothetical protein
LLAGYRSVAAAGPWKDRPTAYEFHDRPYGDFYMDVAEPFRRRGIGCFVIQELKRICYEVGAIPCARCSTSNAASRRTPQNARFVPSAHILVGSFGTPTHVQHAHA